MEVTGMKRKGRVSLPEALWCCYLHLNSVSHQNLTAAFHKHLRMQESTRPRHSSLHSASPCSSHAAKSPEYHSIHLHNPKSPNTAMFCVFRMCSVQPPLSVYMWGPTSVVVSRLPCSAAHLQVAHTQPTALESLSLSSSLHKSSSREAQKHDEYVG